MKVYRCAMCHTVFAHSRMSVVTVEGARYDMCSTNCERQAKVVLGSRYQETLYDTDVETKDDDHS